MPTQPLDIAKVGSRQVVSMNFKVSADFRREFKTFAVQNSKSMLELLQDAFMLIKKQHR